VVKQAATLDQPGDGDPDVTALGGDPADIVATAIEQRLLIAAAGDVAVGADLANGDRADVFRPKIQAAIMKFLTESRP
jgi:hypothetical protein